MTSREKGIFGKLNKLLPVFEIHADSDQGRGRDTARVFFG
jgi:hypothetical protein